MNETEIQKDNSLVIKNKSHTVFICPIDIHLGLTLSQMANLDSSKLKQFAYDNFKLNENGRKFSKRVENIVGKGEIASYEQFLLFPLCFQKTCTADK